MIATKSITVYILLPMNSGASYANWTVTDPESFLQKAKDNLSIAEEAKNHGKFDIEANRIYFALHQLACELVRLSKMAVTRTGKNATPNRPYKIDHGSYHQEISKLIGYNADIVYTQWAILRNMADYNHELISSSQMWLKTINRKRNDAFKVAEEIYGKLRAIP